MTTNYFGSSPLARGLHMDRADAPSRIRIIPARAGFTPTDFQVYGNSMDHPRSRGVYHGLCRRSRVGHGSSPLARGLRMTSGRRTFVIRIIPARAGFTEYADEVTEPTTDHPRSRGVYTK